MASVCKVEPTSVHSKIMVPRELPESVLSLIWDHVHVGLRPGLKARLWADVHAELLAMELDFEYDDPELDSEYDDPELDSEYDEPERDYPPVELCNGCGCELEYAAEDIYICMSC